MKIQEKAKELLPVLMQEFDEREASQLLKVMVMDWFGVSLTSSKVLTEREAQQFDDGVKVLLAGKPVQHVTGKAFFYESEFVVNENVLIPRPETEELVHYIYNDYKSKASVKMLDIGTGSGCIPLSLKKAMPQHDISAIDVSEKALVVAKQNAQLLELEVSFVLQDVFEPIDLGQFDVLMSNPPYIPHVDKAMMSDKVLDYEPHLALFVPDEDWLLYYRRVLELVKEGVLVKGGKVYFEIHHLAVEALTELLHKMSFTDFEFIQDLQGADRMLIVHNK